MSNATSRMPAAMASGIVLRGRSPRVIAARLLGAVPALQAAHRLEPSGPIEDRIAAIESRVAGRLGTKTFAVETGRGRQLAIAEVRVEALQAARSGGAQPLVSPRAARWNDHRTSWLTTPLPPRSRFSRDWFAPKGLHDRAPGIRSSEPVE